MARLRVAVVASVRRIMRAPFISAFLFAFLVVAACSNIGMAGPAEQGAMGEV